MEEEDPDGPREESTYLFKFSPPAERFFFVGRPRAEAGDRGLVLLPASATVTQIALFDGLAPR